MNVHVWTPISRDFIRLEGITVDGLPVDVADLTVALVPRWDGLDAATVWLPTVPDPVDSVPAILVAGPDADPTNAVVLTAVDTYLHGRVVKTGTVVTAPLARIRLLG